MEEGAGRSSSGRRSAPQARARGAQDVASAAEDGAAASCEGILKRLPNAVVSVDTYKAETARAMRAGAQIVNDVSGFYMGLCRSLMYAGFKRAYVSRGAARMARATAA